MKKQTAVEWFTQWLKDNPVVREKDYYAAIEWAKAMEKEQIIGAANNGCKGTCMIDTSVDGQQYYNETYGGDHIGEVNEIINP